MVLIGCVTRLTVGGAKTAYALAARCLMPRIRNPTQAKVLQTAAAGLMIGTGSYLILKN